MCTVTPKNGNVIRNREIFQYYYNFFKNVIYKCVFNNHSLFITHTQKWVFDKKFILF